MRRLHMQVQFIGYALGNSKKYQGKSMVEAHQNLKGLQMTHFDAVGQYLKEALEELEVNEVPALGELWQRRSKIGRDITL